MAKKEHKKQEKKAASKIKPEIKDFQELLKEYHINDPNITPKMILDKITENLEYYIKIVIQLLQPEEFHSMHESTVFDDKEKSVIFDLYKNMMMLHRELMKSHVKNDEKDILSTIHYAHDEMKKLKPQILDILHKMQESWKRTGTNGRVKYFG